MNLKIIILLVFFIGLLACSEPETSTNKTTEKDLNNKQHLLSEHEKMLQKAKDVEKQLQEADEKRRKALEDQGG